MPDTEIQNHTYPPSQVVIITRVDGQFVILAQEPTRIPDIPVRPIFLRHKRYMDPRYEASMMAKYYYEKSEAGKIGYNSDKGILV